MLRILAALAVVMAIVASTAAPVFAEARHPVCEAQRHDCDQPARIASCCCHDEGAPDPATPAQARSEQVPSLSALPMLFLHQAELSFAPVTRPAAAPLPHLSRLDLPTLLATLLI